MGSPIYKVQEEMVLQESTLLAKLEEVLQPWCVKIDSLYISKESEKQVVC
tara:strand:- start:321 stop:470 length:150 start_codon:yes stop_codon:yes gene_type:complete